MSAPLRQAIKQTLALSSKRRLLLTTEKLWRQSACLLCTAEAVKKREWQLHSAVYLQRHPTLTAEMTDIEKDFKEYMEKVEFKNSLMSDHELALKAEAKQKTIGVYSTLDLEDKWLKTFEEFKLASRVTEADKTNDMKSIRRKLDQKLILIVKRKNWSVEPVWCLPQMRLNDGESMRQTAERALKTTCGDQLEASFLGNAPSGYSTYLLPSDVKEFGVKVFYYKASYQSGSLIDTEHIEEYKWVTLDEAKEYLSNAMYRELRKFDISL